MAYVSIPGASSSRSSQYFTRAQQFTGASNGELYFEDMVRTIAGLPPGWVGGNSGTGAYSGVIASTKGGWNQLTSGGSTNGVGEMYTTPNIVSSVLTDAWYLVMAFKITSTITNVTRLLGGLVYTTGTANSVIIGAVGAASTTNYLVLYDGDYASTTTAVDTGVAIDTSRHVIEAYCRGDSKLRVRVDGGNELASPPTMASASTSAYALLMSARNVSNATAQTMQVDFIGCYYPHAA